MILVAATGNAGKLKELKEQFEHDVVAYQELIDLDDIVEDGDSFQANAIIKAETVYRILKERDGKDYLVISDDSGISVPALGEEPGIYSARYAGTGASDQDNLNKLIENLKQRGMTETPAFYTCAITLASSWGTFTGHGWMHGKVIDSPRGDQGFGYDPMFVPIGYEKTLGELDKAVKRQFSHRSRALALVRPLVMKLADV